MHGTLDLDAFLAMLHDKMVPDYVRRSIDFIRLDVPMGMIANAANNLAKLGGLGADIYTDDQNEKDKNANSAFMGADGPTEKQ